MAEHLRFQHESNHPVRKIKMRVSNFRFLVENLADFADDEIVTIQAFSDVLNENEPPFSWLSVVSPMTRRRKASELLSSTG